MTFGYIKNAKELQATFSELVPIMKKGMEGVHAPIAVSVSLRQPFSDMYALYLP
jgi:hypothetical protein